MVERILIYESGEREVASTKLQAFLLFNKSFLLKPQKGAKWS